jgi:peptidoglycan hydrolase-like protein with peptidoglycan-binding domain
MTHKIFAAVSALIILSPFLASAATLSMQLDPGMTNSDVTALQTFLSTDSSIYPEALVTGFYGPLTVAAVTRYQTRFGIPAVGRVGPVTLASINGNGGTGGSDDVNAPITNVVNVSTGTNSATIAWSSNEAVFGRVMYSTTLPLIYATASSVSSVSGFNSAQAASLTGLQPQTTYFYVLESTDASGNLTWTIGRSLKTQ